MKTLSEKIANTIKLAKKLKGAHSEISTIYFEFIDEDVAEMRAVGKEYHIDKLKFADYYSADYYSSVMLHISDIETYTIFVYSSPLEVEEYIMQNKVMRNV